MHNFGNNVKATYGSDSVKLTWNGKTIATVNTSTHKAKHVSADKLPAPVANTMLVAIDWLKQLVG